MPSLTNNAPLVAKPISTAVEQNNIAAPEIQNPNEINKLEAKLENIVFESKNNHDDLYITDDERNDSLEDELNQNLKPTKTNNSEGSDFFDDFVSMDNVVSDAELKQRWEDKVQHQLNKDRSKWYIPSNNNLNQELANRTSELSSNPKDVFSFIAKKTNPNRILFNLKNLASIVADLFRFKKPELLLNKNCVSCSRAVDETLNTIVNPNNEVRVYQSQVNTLKSCKLYIINGYQENEHKFIADQDAKKGQPNALIAQLLERVPKGMRAVIGVPVRGIDNLGHAMNLVRLNNGNDFIICGQRGRVWNLNLMTDIEDFNSRYGNDNNKNSPSQSYATVTGDAPNVEHNDTDFKNVNFA